VTKLVLLMALMGLVSNISPVTAAARVPEGNDGTDSAKTTGGPPTGINTSPEILYMTDTYMAKDPRGRMSGDLHYIVFSPTTRGPHPIVFGMQGSGFKGTADCMGGKHTQYRNIDRHLFPWVQAGFVAVNIEYHGYANGLYGDLTYPGKGKWGDIADGTVELNVKPAVLHFLSHDPGQYGADPSLGMVAFGGSSGAHNAHMLGITGVPGCHFACVVAWSGQPDNTDNEENPHFNSLYMRTTNGSDKEWFADPMHRLTASSPPQYTANGLDEFIHSKNAIVYQEYCVKVLGPDNCWLRIPNTNLHAAAYANYKFIGVAPEVTSPPAVVGTTVEQDSILFASRYVKGAKP
jgi:hypothetical protein